VVLRVDRFGNLITNFTAHDAPRLFAASVPPFKIVAGKREVSSMRTSYSEGAPGELFAILGSMGFIEIAANRGSAAQLSGAGKGTEVLLVLGEETANAVSNGQ
jgi:S-adenosylmethionine hydrolase